jgi:hypothetical protein
VSLPAPAAKWTTSCCGPLENDRLNSALRACVSVQVLEVSDDRRGYRFRHALLQEVCASELLPRNAAHAQVERPVTGYSAADDRTVS